MWRGGPEGMKVGRSDEKKVQKGQTPTPLLIFFSISHLLGLILNPVFCCTLTLRSILPNDLVILKK